MKQSKVYLLLCLCFSSCAMYRYTYNQEKQIIISDKGNKIKAVHIRSKSSSLNAAMFEAIDEGLVYFSLIELGKGYYKSNREFYFYPNSEYSITIFPQGDRKLLDINIKTDSLSIPYKE